MEVNMTSAVNIAEFRLRLARERGLRIAEVFHTFERSGGVKDVSLCERADGSREILRIGEARPPSFFPEGYEGSAMRIPRLYERGDDPVPFEREEYLEGALGTEDRRLEEEGRIPPDVLQRILAAFWEFQEACGRVSLPEKPTTEKILKHLEGARPLLRHPERARDTVRMNAAFWGKPFPSKWKFALGNLVFMPDGKIGLIDNANAGLRWFGYDLGWIIWPRWIGMATEAYARPLDQIAYLESFSDAAKRGMPRGLMSEDAFERAFWLVVFERLIGAAYDLVRFTPHMAHHGMGRDDPPERRDAHAAFLLDLMEVVSGRLA
jgi:hypothetical protein